MPGGSGGEKMRKRILALLLAAATALGLCACAPVEETDSGKLSVV